MSEPVISEVTSPPVMHFIDEPKETSISSVHEEESVVPTPVPVSMEENDENKRITTVSHNRRVHFPTDDAQLRLFSFPSEPLANQPLVSLGVILQRYRGACQRLQLRPIAALLDQLNNMDDGRKSFYDRIDRLRIVNEKIDIRHVDALEEIFSRCRFHTLDLESTSIEDSAMSQLFDVLEYYESCTHLILSNNRSLNFHSYQLMMKYLRRTNCLERLDMNAIRFDDVSIISFTRALRLSTTLYELHVESCQLNGKLLQRFIENLRSCACLRELYLCDNRLQVQDSLLINQLIRTCGQFLFLLDLRSNSIGDTGASHLASQFSQYDEHHTHENSLHKISLQANQLTQQGVGFLAKALLHNRTLRSLNLSDNNITNEGLFLLRDALLTNRTINELILRNCRLTDQAAIALAEFIAESTTIHYIDLRENTFQASGICGMAIAIKNNRSLLKLDFDPIIPVPTSHNTFSNKTNIDRTNNSNSLLSLANLRRMTTGFGSFTSGTTTNSIVAGGGTRELLEQKARWINDIAAVCQRNILIYEENLRLQEDAQNGFRQSPTTTSETPVIQSEDVDMNIETNTSNGVTNENVEQLDHDLIPNESVSDDVEKKDDENGEMESDEKTINTHEEIFDDDKRKLRHSDSIYLLRKKVKKRPELSTIDDEKLSISSIEEADEEETAAAAAAEPPPPPSEAN